MDSSNRSSLFSEFDIKYVDSPKKFVGLLAAIWLAFVIFTTPGKKRPNAPVFGYRSIFEPTLLLQSRFILGAESIIRGAYKTVSMTPVMTSSN